MGKEGAVPAFTLNTGASMPAVALGISAIRESPEETKVQVLKSLEIGYRALDTAKFYRSEPAVGEALQEAFKVGTVKREDVFVTTKIWADDMHPPDIIPALRKSLSDLKLEYVDVCLLHQPFRFRKGAVDVKNEDHLPFDGVGVWKALEEGKELGLAKAIGVSNFNTRLLKKIEAEAKFLPAVNQVEMHPGCEQTKLREYCKEKGILVTAWSPLGAPGYDKKWGSNLVLDNPILKAIAEERGKTIGEVALRWALDKGVGLTVKSSNPERMAQNLDLFDWKLTADEHAKIATTPSFRLFDGSIFFQHPNFPYRSYEEMWDD